jgi:hypothetical protein
VIETFDGYTKRALAQELLDLVSIPNLISQVNSVVPLVVVVTMVVLGVKADVINMREVQNLLLLVSGKVGSKVP